MKLSGLPFYPTLPSSTFPSALVAAGRGRTLVEIGTEHFTLSPGDAYQLARHLGLKSTPRSAAPLSNRHTTPSGHLGGLAHRLGIHRPDGGWWLNFQTSHHRTQRTLDFLFSIPEPGETS